MALVLALLFRARPRLLPLGLALCAAAIILRRARVAGVAVDDGVDRGAAVLLGLAVDYEIRPGARPSVGSLATAALATAVGFLVLLLSPVPMVRGFGALLVVAWAWRWAVAAGAAALVLAARGALRAALARCSAGRATSWTAPAARWPPFGAGSSDHRGVARRCARAARAARDLVARAPDRPAPRPRARRRRRARRLRLGAGLADRDRLRPSAARAAGPRRGSRPRRAAARHRGSGRGRRARRGADLTDPKVDRVDARLPEELLTRHGYNAQKGCSGASCARRSRCPTCSARPRCRRRASRSARCWTPSRPTSRRPRSRRTGARRCSPSASACSRSTRSAR